MAPCSRGHNSCMPHTQPWFLAPHLLQSSHPCCTLAAWVRSGSFNCGPVQMGLLEPRICIKTLYVILMSCKTSRVILVHRSWLPLTLFWSSSDLAGTNHYPWLPQQGQPPEPHSWITLPFWSGHPLEPLWGEYSFWQTAVLMAVLKCQQIKAWT